MEAANNDRMHPACAASTYNACCDQVATNQHECVASSPVVELALHLQSKLSYTVSRPVSLVITDLTAKMERRQLYNRLVSDL
jgi:hypothetical protein